MTNEKQTISNLRKLKSFHNGSYGADIDRAIKALEQEPTKEEKALLQKWRDNRGISMEEFEAAMNVLQEPQTDKDCIYREDAIDAIMRYLGRINRDFEAYRGTAKIILNHLPSVDPKEPKTGHWIKSLDSYGNNHFTCPFCEHDIATKADTLGDNYCSNCGAKLQESEG